MKKLLIVMIGAGCASLALDADTVIWSQQGQT